MKEFLLLLFFSKWVLLTPEPVTLNSYWLEIIPKETISALNSGASLRIQIPTDEGGIKRIDKTKHNIFEQLDELYPAGILEAYLYGEKNYVVYLSKRNFSISDYTFEKEESLHILLNPGIAMPTGIKYNRLKIRSSQEIKNVKLIWQNASE